MGSPREPIAVIGVGCRFPGGVTSPDGYWDLLLGGRETVREMPPERWAPYARRSPDDAAVLRRTTKAGSFLDGIEDFDAEFFGVPAREAALMDPQHRLAMEVAWEALEHAGVPASSLAGTDTGVYVGTNTDDYGRRMLEDLPGIDAWTCIGASPCGAANRISHVLDLRGPSVTFDTACSASLVAVHQAMQALWLDDVGVALAGGVMIMAGPAQNVALDAAGAISPDGRSKPFDATADGYGRGEGCGFVVLKRLSDAQAAGDRVLAVLRGGAIRQDGRTAGIMAPSRSAQEHLLRSAYRAAGVDPSTVDYVEAHGTGTPVGDPIEAGALGEVVAPCLIGSVKGNFGHLEAAAGVAGLIKAVLAVDRGLIPPTVSASGRQNPEIDWAGTGLRLVTEATPWPREPRRAGVTSYGFGGTGAHLVIEQAPARDPLPAAPVGRTLYPVSGASWEALRDNTSRLRDWLASHPSVPLSDIGHTLASGRTHLPYRAAVVAATGEELAAGLADVNTAYPAYETVAPVWVFSGHGSHWTGMGRGLLADEPAFAEVIDKLEPVYTEELGMSARELLTSAELSRTELAQAAIFAVQAGLTAVWRGYGARPGAVIGHSVGEIAAAAAAGVLDVEDAARLACRRALLLRRVIGYGAMAMIPKPFDELTGIPGLEAAIESSPYSTVVSGTLEAVTELLHDGGRWVDSDVAFHSRQMEPLCDELAVAAKDLRPSAPVVPLYSTVDPATTPSGDADYWVANLRRPVMLASAVQAAARDGHRLFLEISGHPVVAHSIAETLPEATVVASLRRGKPERPALLAHAALLYREGVALDWTVFQPGGELADLPANAWRHRRYWVDEEPPRAGGQGHDPASRTLLGDHEVVLATTPAICWRTRIDHRNRPYPGTHPVLGSEIVPAAILLTTLLTASGGTALRDVELLVPITTSPARALQVTRQDGLLRIATGTGDEWQTHTNAHVADAAPEGGTRVPRGEPLDPALVRDHLTSVGVPEMGLPWQVDALWRDDAWLYARVSTVEGWAGLLDAALSVSAVALRDKVLQMPSHIAGVHTSADAPAEALLAIRVEDDLLDIDIADESGGVIGSVHGLRFGSPEIAPSEEPFRPVADPDPVGGGVDIPATVREVAAATLGIEAERLDIARPLTSLGLDSLLSVTFRRELGRRIGRELPAPLLWHHPTVAAIANHLTTAAAA